ncbi:hypothetical protein GGF50DRAFT_117149 [Schizophyllum commune]
MLEVVVLRLSPEIALLPSPEIALLPSPEITILTSPEGCLPPVSSSLRTFAEIAYFPHFPSPPPSSASSRLPSSPSPLPPPSLLPSSPPPRPSPSRAFLPASYELAPSPQPMTPDVHDPQPTSVPSFPTSMTPDGSMRAPSTPGFYAPLVPGSYRRGSVQR